MVRYIMYYADNYADEFDVNGTRCITLNEYHQILELMDGFIESNFYFGTNEFIEYDEFDLIRAISFRRIEQEEYEVLKRYDLLSTGFGKEIFNFIMENEENS